MLKHKRVAETLSPEYLWNGSSKQRRSSTSNCELFRRVNMPPKVNFVMSKKTANEPILQPQLRNYLHYQSIPTEL